MKNHELKINIHRITPINDYTNNEYTHNDSPIQQFNKSAIQQITHPTLSPDRSRSCRIARLPHEGEAFASNRHALKVPPDEGGTQGGKIRKTTNLSLL
ncbi:hypothetical protein DRI50_08450 [candidate division KSB1 bacterium]|nr:MAG: hypothetical protein DRI50_08450 [candidate division KSB1 bacterium]